jgi:hypothetical protein
MAYYDTEELWFPERDHGGTPWVNPEGYDKHKPRELRPELEDADARHPLREGLPGRGDRRASAPSTLSSAAASRAKLLYFPDENHWVLKPQNSILWHDHRAGLAGSMAEGEGIRQEKALNAS